MDCENKVGDINDYPSDDVEHSETDLTPGENVDEIKCIRINKSVSREIRSRDSPEIINETTTVDTATRVKNNMDVGTTSDEHTLLNTGIGNDAKDRNKLLGCDNYSEPIDDKESKDKIVPQYPVISEETQFQSDNTDTAEFQIAPSKFYQTGSSSRNNTLTEKEVDNQALYKDTKQQPSKNYNGLSSRIAKTLRNLLNRKSHEKPAERKFFKRKLETDDSSKEPDVELLANIDVKKVMKIVTKPNHAELIKPNKQSSKSHLKTYSNRRKSYHKNNVIESFALPDDPIIPVEKPLIPLAVDSLTVSTSSSHDISISCPRNTWEEQDFDTKKIRYSEEIRVKNCQEPSTCNDSFEDDQQNISSLFCEDETSNKSVKNANDSGMVIDILTHKQGKQNKNDNSPKVTKSICKKTNDTAVINNNDNKNRITRSIIAKRLLEGNLLSTSDTLLDFSPVASNVCLDESIKEVSDDHSKIIEAVTSVKTRKSEISKKNISIISQPSENLTITDNKFEEGVSKDTAVMKNQLRKYSRGRKLLAQSKTTSISINSNNQNDSIEGGECHSQINDKSCENHLEEENENTAQADSDSKPRSTLPIKHWNIHQNVKSLFDTNKSASKDGQTPSEVVLDNDMVSKKTRVQMRTRLLFISKSDSSLALPSTTRNENISLINSLNIETSASSKKDHKCSKNRKIIQRSEKNPLRDSEIKVVIQKVDKDIADSKLKSVNSIIRSINTCNLNVKGNAQKANDNNISENLTTVAENKTDHSPIKDQNCTKGTENKTDHYFPIKHKNCTKDKNIESDNYINALPPSVRSKSSLKIIDECQSNAIDDTDMIKDKNIESDDCVDALKKKEDTKHKELKTNENSVSTDSINNLLRSEKTPDRNRKYCNREGMRVHQGLQITTGTPKKSWSKLKRWQSQPNLTAMDINIDTVQPSINRSKNRSRKIESFYTGASTNDPNSDTDTENISEDPQLPVKSKNDVTSRRIISKNITESDNTKNKTIDKDPLVDKVTKRKTEVKNWFKDKLNESNCQENRRSLRLFINSTIFEDDNQTNVAGGGRKSRSARKTIHHTEDKLVDDNQANVADEGIATNVRYSRSRSPRKTIHHYTKDKQVEQNPEASLEDDNQMNVANEAISNVGNSRSKSPRNTVHHTEENLVGQNPDASFVDDNHMNVSANVRYSRSRSPRKTIHHHTKDDPRDIHVEKTPKEKVGAVETPSNQVMKVSDIQPIRKNIKQDSKLTRIFNVGDLVWAKLGNFPHWPSMITTSPDTNDHKQEKIHPHRRYYIYHVTFFGDSARRAWISAIHLVPFQNADDIYVLPELKTETLRFCNQKLRFNWKTGVKEATSLASKPVRARPKYFSLVKEPQDHGSRRSRSVVRESFYTKRKRTKSLPVFKSKYMREDESETQLDHTIPLIKKQKTESRLELESSSIDKPKRGRPRKSISSNEEESETVTTNLKNNTSLMDRPKRGRPSKSINSNEEESVTAAANLDINPSLMDKPKQGRTRKSTNLNTKAGDVGESSQEVKSRHQRDTSEQTKDSIEFTSKRKISLRSKSPEKTKRLHSPEKSIKDAKLEKSSRINSIATTSDKEALENRYSSRLRQQTVKQPQYLENYISDTDSKLSENSSVPTSLQSQAALYKRNNIFRGVPKEKVCQICQRTDNVVRCKGKCNGLFHKDCIEKLVYKQSTDIVNKKSNSWLNAISSKNTVSEVIKGVEDSDTKHNQDDRVTPTVEIISIQSRVSNELPNLLTMSPNFRKLSLAEKIDYKMKEIMMANESYPTYLESTDSSLDEICASELLLDEIKSFQADTHEKQKSEKRKRKPHVIKHVTADDVRFITLDEDSSCSSKESQKQSKNGSVIVEDTLTNKTSEKKFEVIKDFKCGFCTANIEPNCFVCRKAISKKGSTIRQLCSLPRCGKYYHPECLKMWPQTQWSLISTTKHRESNKSLDTFVCPMHICHTCASDDPRAANSRCPSDKLAKCLRCPASYHCATYCVPAGTEILSTNQIICPRHYGEDMEGNLKKPLHVVNTSWCFICSEGGDLFCCETCPTSVHSYCLPVNLTEDNTFICEDCESGRFPLYDEIVWVKFHAYRWWPALILFPNEVPDNVSNLKHSQGEFVVKFFGTSDHYWVSRGIVFLFQEGDQGHSHSTKTKIDTYFIKAIEEAAVAHNLKKEFKLSREAEKNNSLKPPPYIKIKINKPVGNVRQVDFNVSNTTSCDCDPNQPHPCGPESDCLNRILMTECNPQVCPAGNRCNNQCFEKREYPPMVPYKTEGRGWGLKTLAPIRKGQFVIEYVGEIIDEQEYQRRIKKMHEQKEENYYFLTIDKDRMLDAGPKGNAARFMNHCCQPNCDTQKWTVNGDTRVGLFANQDIPAESELTFNYNLECVGKEMKVCRCGAPNCSGFIGEKAKNSEESQKKSKKSLPKAKKKKTDISVDEEESKNPCFICGQLGKVGACNNKICTKYFHLKCVNLDAWPEGGKWVCPWHNCNVCAKRTIRCCVKCINSYCPTHSEGNIRHDNLLGFICAEHDPRKDTIDVQLTKIPVNNSQESTDESTVTSTTPDEVDIIPSTSKHKKTKRLASEKHFINEVITTSTPVKKNIFEGSELQDESTVSSATYDESSNSTLKRKRGRPTKLETENKKQKLLQSADTKVHKTKMSSSLQKYSKTDRTVRSRLQTEHENAF